MAKKSLTQRNLEYLQAKGWTINPNSKTSKYTELTKPSADYRYYLGKSGAVRRGKNVTSSISVKLNLEGKPRTQINTDHSIKAVQADVVLQQATKAAAQQTEQSMRTDPLGQLLTEAGKQEREASAEADPTPDLPVMPGTAPVSTPTPAQSAEAATPAPTSPLSSLLRQAIDHTEDDSPHLIVEARAGTGKSTTLLHGVLRVCGMPSPLTPSPQQQTVWDAMMTSAGKVRSIHMVAFNKPIADSLGEKIRELGLPSWVTASTMHSMGFKAVLSAFPALRGKRMNDYRTRDILGLVMGRDPWEIKTKDLGLLQAVEKLVDLCKMNLVNGTPEELDQLSAHYEVELNGDRTKVYDLVPQVLERGKDPSAGGMIGFADMIWLPVVLNLPMPRYDLLLVDEAQDLNRCQQALAKLAGKRLILCGDPKQAIYGFAGADADSMPRMARELGEVDVIHVDAPSLNVDGTKEYFPSDYIRKVGRGCQTLPLTVTRRCGQAIVAEANKIVPDFSAHESNPDGKVSHAVYPTNKAGKERPKPWYTDRCQDGDMVLCRVNAPLVSQCFRFLKAGRKANIQGRDIGAGLVKTIEKMKAGSVVDLVGKLSAWYHDEVAKENAKRNPSEARLIMLQDRHDCLACFTEGANTVEEVVKKIEAIFTDDKSKAGIRLSSIHRAKGLEAERVFLLQPDGASIPHPMAKSAWQVGQEWNLKYVAITRAIEELVHVS